MANRKIYWSFKLTENYFSLSFDIESYFAQERTSIYIFLYRIYINILYPSLDYFEIHLSREETKSNGKQVASDIRKYFIPTSPALITSRFIYLGKKQKAVENMLLPSNRLRNETCI